MSRRKTDAYLAFESILVNWGVIEKDRETAVALIKEQLNPNFTGLYDTLGKPIMVGNIVHWSDGGDDLSLEERIKTRWDRIAVVGLEGILPQFTVIDSPSERVQHMGGQFNYGSFIYKDTENHLTVVAHSKTNYRVKFHNAAECMVWVSSMRKNRENQGEK